MSNSFKAAGEKQQDVINRLKLKASSSRCCAQDASLSDAAGAGTESSCPCTDSCSQPAAAFGGFRPEAAAAALLLTFSVVRGKDLLYVIKPFRSVIFW